MKNGGVNLFTLDGLGRKIIAIVFLVIIIGGFFITLKYPNNQRQSIIVFWNELFNLSDIEYTSKLGFMDGIFNAITIVSRSVTDSIIHGFYEWIETYSDSSIISSLWGIISIFFKYCLVIPIKILINFFLFAFIKGANISYYVGYILTSIVLGGLIYFYIDE